MIFTHKITGQKLLLKKQGNLVSTYYVVDNQGNKLIQKTQFGRNMIDTNGNQAYQVAVVDNQNVEL